MSYRMSIKDLTGLNPQEAAFVVEYSKDFNARRAAVVAGYSADSGYQVRDKPHVQAALIKIINERLELSHIDAAWVLMEAVDNHQIARQSGNITASNTALNLIAKHTLVDAMAKYELRCHTHVKPAPLNLDAVLDRVCCAAPALEEELQGIADGSGVPFELLLEVNLRALHYCTVIAFTRSDVGPLLGKNLDFAVYAYQVLFTVRPDKGHAMTHIGCAGSVASYGGINSKGLAMGHAIVPLGEDVGDGGLPVAFLRRLALQHCATTSEAVAFLSETLKNKPYSI